MKILTGIDVPFIPFGGSLIACNDWYSDLPKDVEVRFLALKPPTPEVWWSIRDLVLLKTPKTKTAPEFPGYIEALKREVAEQIADFKPDIIHAQHLNYGLSRAFVDLNTTIPTMGICHGTDVQAATTSEFWLDNLRHICDGLDEIVFPNQIMADDLLALHELKTPYTINPAGIPDRMLNNPNPRPAFSGKGRLEVLYAGRLLEWKGPDIAAQAMRFAKNNMHLTVIGNEDQSGYVKSMHDYIAAHHLEDKVTFLPQLPREELLNSFSQYDVIVLPSRRLEAFSLTVIEAQGKGLPVIYAGAGGGIVATVGGAGILLENNTPKGLAAVLDDVYHHPERLEKVRKLGYTNAQKYTMSGSKGRLFDLSRDLIARLAAGTPAQS